MKPVTRWPPSVADPRPRTWPYVLLVIALFLLVGVAWGDEDHTVRWTPPTHCENGEAIGTASCGALVEYVFECSPDPGPPYDDVWRKPAPAVEDTRSYPPGEYYCRLSVRNDGGYSRWSEEELFFSIAVPQSVPNRPTNVTAE